MSFLVEGGLLGLHTSLDLVVTKTIRIPALCIGTLPHDVRLIMDRDTPITSTIWLVRLPHVWTELHLLVDQGPIDTSREVTTLVFNISQEPIKVPKGTVVSRLVSVSLE